ncbi:uncharacterized protein isoform X4 [Castor canadensis]|uniref:Uncharacterized protein isoform X4 n=1 Tax=Castor canadensis TaxID=51338 RepID=A0AC58KGB4_CASCN
MGSNAPALAGPRARDPGPRCPKVGTRWEDGAGEHRWQPGHDAAEVRWQQRRQPGGCVEEAAAAAARRRASHLGRVGAPPPSRPLSSTWTGDLQQSRIQHHGQLLGTLNSKFPQGAQARFVGSVLCKWVQNEVKSEA